MTGRVDARQVHTPAAKPARFRQWMPEAQAKQGEGYAAKLNYLECLVNAARCEICAFRDRPTSECRAYPPRLVMREGKAKAEWPVVGLEDWCGCWRQA